VTTDESAKPDLADLLCQATGAVNRREFDAVMGGIVDLRDGRVVRWEDFGSRQAALEAAGMA
jgi:hypothetical protein